MELSTNLELDAYNIGLFNAPFKFCTNVLDLDFVKFQIAFTICQKTMNSQHTLARDRFLVNKGCDWLSDSLSSHWAWLILGKMLP